MSDFSDWRRTLRILAVNEPCAVVILFHFARDCFSCDFFEVTRLDLACISFFCPTSSRKVSSVSVNVGTVVIQDSVAALLDFKGLAADLLI